MTYLGKKKFFIFDLDGVIFDSKKNMELAWNETSTKFNLNIPFVHYFNKIGRPFPEILKSLDVLPNEEIYKCFQETSLKYIDEIKPYKGVIKSLNLLKNNSKKFSIVTSKDLRRTKFLLKKFNIQPSTIHCPNNKLMGKPHPDHLIDSVKKNFVNKKDACYFGDTNIDFEAAKAASIDFVFVNYGYGQYNKEFGCQISCFLEIMEFV